MTDQTAFEYRDVHGDVFQARPTVTSDGPRVALEANLSIPVFVPLDRVEEVVAGIRGAARQAAGQPAAEHPRARALRLGAATIPDDVVAEISEATNSGVPLPWPEYTDRDADVWHLTDETHDGDRVMLPSAGDMAPMLRRDVQRFFGPLTAAGQPATDLPTYPACGSHSLPTYSGDVVRCVLATGHTGQCQSATEYPYVSWPNPSNGVWNPAAGLAAPTNHNTEAEQRAYDNLYAELTRGVAHAQVRHHLITEYRAAILNSAAEAVDKAADGEQDYYAPQGMYQAVDLLRRLAAGAES